MEIKTPVLESTQTDKIALIDADFIKYYVVNSIYKDIEKKTAFIYENPVHHYVNENLNVIFEHVKAKAYLFCFSGASINNYRTFVGFEKLYKGERDYIEKYPKEMEDKHEVIKYIQERYATLLFKDLEADDVISMIQDKDTFIYSYDKDLLQIPGTHFDIKSKELIEVSKDQSFRFLMYQLLEGDSVDNIPGLKNYGKVKVGNLLDTVETKQLLKVVMQEFHNKHGLFEGTDMFVEMWNLCKLRLNRGTYFLSKYKHAFDTLRMLK